MNKFNFIKENNSIVNYYYFENSLTNEEIDNIINISQKYDTKDGTINNIVNTSYRNSKIKWLPLNDETEFIYKKIFDLTQIANKNMWNFNISFFKEDLQLSEYSDEYEGHYDWHMDFGENVSTRKLSITIQLNDPEEYEGGELNFQIHRNIIKAPNKKGTVIVFPSFLLHKVTKVTKGTRRSLVCWIHGPPFV
jgi:PKHD-type hydroxylase